MQHFYLLKKNVRSDHQSYILCLTFVIISPGFLARTLTVVWLLHYSWTRGTGPLVSARAGPDPRPHLGSDLDLLRTADAVLEVLCFHGLMNEPTKNDITNNYNQYR